MTRVERILLRARDTLGDQKKERWSDDRLIRLLDEGQMDICTRAKLLRTKTQQVVFEAKSHYTLPEDFLTLDKVSINNEPIPLIGHTELDMTVPKWEEAEGAVEYVVYDKQMRGHVRLYPIPKYTNNEYLKIAPSYNSYTYGIVRGTYGALAFVNEPSEMPDGNYGITTEITGIFQYTEELVGMPKVVVKDYEFLQPYGVVVDILFNIDRNKPIDPNVGIVTSVTGTQIDTFGVMTNVTPSEGHSIYFTDKFGSGTAFREFQDEFYFTYFRQRGEVVEICGADLTTDFGVLADIQYPDTQNIVFDSPYGLTSDITKVQNIMTIWYLRKPKTIESIYSEIEIDDSFDNALKYYICGKAFRDDLDTQNRAMGAEELNLYERELVKALKDDSTDFTRSANKATTTRYNGAGLF